MTTKLISLNEYRKNISTLWKKWREENIKYIVMVHSKPMFEVKPIISDTFDDNWDEYTKENEIAWKNAKRELEEGNVMNIDFNEIKSEDEFISKLKSN